MNKKILLLFLCFLLFLPFLKIKAENNQTHNGDGTYDLTTGDTVILNNGAKAVFEHAYNNYGAEGTDNFAFHEIRFDLYNPEGSFISKTKWLRVGSNNNFEIFQESEKTKGFSVIYNSGADEGFNNVTLTSIEINRPDLIIFETGIKYFNTGNPCNYYYAIIQNIGDSFTFSSSDNLGINFKGSTGWLGDSNESVYYTQKQYSQGDVIQKSPKGS